MCGWPIAKCVELDRVPTNNGLPKKPQRLCTFSQCEYTHSLADTEQSKRTHAHTRTQIIQQSEKRRETATICKFCSLLNLYVFTLFFQSLHRHQQHDDDDRFLSQTAFYSDGSNDENEKRLQPSIP